MALTEAEYQALIITEVGDDTTGTLATNVPVYWSMRDTIADLALRYLYVKRDAIILMMGKLRDLVDMSSGGDSIKLSQQITNLRTLLEVLESQLEQVSQTGGASAAAGQLTQTAPILPPPGAFDANSQDYRGNVYLNRRRRR
jgi:hypothetical protein